MMTRRQKLVERALRADLRNADLALEGAADLSAIVKVADEGATIKQYRGDREHTCQVTGQVYLESDGATIGWHHLRRLVEETVAGLDYRIGGKIPYNVFQDFRILGRRGRLSSPRFASREGAEQVVSEVLRFCGWLRAAAKLPAVRRVILKTQSSNGLSSPHTKISLGRLVELHPSPGRLERTLWKVKARTKQILAAYDGFSEPSWLAITKAVMITTTVGKAAVIAAAYTILGEEWDRYCSFKGYREAREWLVEYRKCSVADESDGVLARREAEPTFRKCGIAVYQTAMPILNKKGHRTGTTKGRLVRSEDGRTYHPNGYYSNDRDCISEAVRAWKEQDRLAQENADLVGFLEGKLGFSPLVYRQDSYDAGNCGPGTASWLHQQGWSNRPFLPGPWLIQHLGHGLVKNVVAKLYQTYTTAA